MHHLLRSCATTIMGTTTSTTSAAGATATPTDFLLLTAASTTAPAGMTIGNPGLCCCCCCCNYHATTMTTTPARGLPLLPPLARSLLQSYRQQDLHGSSPFFSWQCLTFHTVATMLIYSQSVYGTASIVRTNPKRASRRMEFRQGSRVRDGGFGVGPQHL